MEADKPSDAEDRSVPLVSIVIPTKDRPSSLGRLLDCLADQSESLEFEVVVIDDSSGGETRQISTARVYPFPLRYIRGNRCGAVGARNTGVSQARGGIIILLDDDIVVGKGFLLAMTNELARFPRSVVIADILPYGNDSQVEASPFGAIYGNPARQERSGRGTCQPHFAACMTGALGIRREHYWEVGGMQALGEDSRGAWTDLLFGYQATAKGLEVRRCAEAIAYHDDHALASLGTYCHIAERSAREAALLFRRYPELQPHVRMFRDKAPVCWHHDHPRLILRKLARQMVSTKPVLRGMEQMARFLERHHPRAYLLRPLYRWIVGSYIYRGYRHGLRQYGPVAGSMTR